MLPHWSIVDQSRDGIRFRLDAIEERGREREDREQSVCSAAVSSSHGNLELR